MRLALLSICLFVIGCASGPSSAVSPAPQVSPLQSTLQSSAAHNLSGTVTAILSSTEFSYETGVPHGHVPVTYAESEVSPAGHKIAVGDKATVSGTFDQDGHLTATSVEIGNATPPPSPSPTPSHGPSPSPSPS